MAGTVSKIIVLDDEQDSWIKAQSDAGLYLSESKYVGALVRRDQQRSADDSAICAALIEGEASGEARLFDADSFREAMVAK